MRSRVGRLPRRPKHRLVVQRKGLRLAVLPLWLAAAAAARALAFTGFYRVVSPELETAFSPFRDHDFPPTGYQPLVC